MKVRPLTLLVLLALLAVPSIALAEDAPSPALAACRADYQALGSAGFVAKYGAGEAGTRACLAAHGGTTPPTTAPKPTTPAPTANPREAACKAEYQSLGATAFATKYGPGADGMRACIGGTTAPKPGDTSGTPAASIAAQLCEIEYKRGADAFVAKYGIGDAGKRACLQAKAAQATAIVALCKNAAEPAACAKASLGDVVADGATDDKPKPDAKPKVVPKVTGLGAGSVAEAMCKAEAASLGTRAFVAKYGAGKLGACVKATLAKATSYVAACKGSSAGNKDLLRQCLTSALANTRRR